MPTVEAFLVNLRRIRQGLSGRYPEFSELESVLAGVRSGGLARRGRTADGFGYSVHGRGCLLIDPDGMEVDMDLLPGGWEVFDVWRLQQFAKSAGAEFAPDGDVLLHECRQLVRSGALREPERGWFSACAD